MIPAPELSTHEKRLAALAAEIAKLEDENVSDKPWLLMGEANAKKRPENSLLETDLEFEQSAKPAPSITEEVAKNLEDLIKARILEVSRYVTPYTDMGLICRLPRAGSTM